LSTKAIVRYRKQERIQRQANQRIADTLSGDQRRILRLSQEGYNPGEIARELALSADYTLDFMTGLVQRLTHDGLIPSPEWGNVLQWAVQLDLLR
jgi:DNA-binding CsgD family transcriptional regulator